MAVHEAARATGIRNGAEQRTGTEWRQGGLLKRRFTQNQMMRGHAAAFIMLSAREQAAKAHPGKEKVYRVARADHHPHRDNRQSVSP